jgi:hypothetical protein
VAAPKLLALQRWQPLGYQHLTGDLAMLPLAWSVSLLLLLSSLSLQALALQEGSLQALRERRRQQEDQLMTAAQRLAGRLQRRHPCLLTLADGAWAAAGCATADELAALRQGLRAYRPDPGEGRAELLLQQGNEAAAAFALHWRRADGEGPPQLVALRELGLRQVRP